MFKRLIGNAPQSEAAEMRSIVVMQRKAHLFTEEELQVAGERGWGKKLMEEKIRCFSSRPITPL